MTRVADRIKETAIGVGTGNISLVGAKDGFRTFAAGLGEFDEFYYAIELDGTTEFEVGIGRFADANKNSIVRSVVLASSNGGELVDFTAGAKTAMLVVTAENFTPTHEVVTGNVIQSKRSNGLITLGAGVPAYVQLPPSPLATAALGVEPRPQGWSAYIRNRSGGTVTLRRHSSENANTTVVNGARGVELPNNALAILLADDQGWRIEGNLAALTAVTNAVINFNSARFTTPYVAQNAIAAGPNVFYTHASGTAVVEARNVSNGSVIATYTHATEFGSLTVLDENHVMFVSSTDFDTVQAYVLTLAGNSLTASAPVTVADSGGNGTSDWGMLIGMSASSAIMWWADDMDGIVYFVPLSISGNVVTPGTQVATTYDLVNAGSAVARVSDTTFVIVGMTTGWVLDLLNIYALDTPVQRVTSFGWTEDTGTIHYFPVLHVDAGVLQILWTSNFGAVDQVRIAVASVNATAIGTISTHQLATGYKAANVPQITSYGANYIVGITPEGAASFHHLVYSASANAAALVADHTQAVANLTCGVPVAGLLVSSLTAAPTADYFVEEVI